MTKQEIINEIAALPYVGEMLSLESVHNSLPAGTFLYRQGVIVIDTVENVAKEHAYYFYVIDEGEATEAAYYNSKRPENPNQTKHWLEEKYQSQIDQRNGTVVESGDNWIVVTGYEEDGTTGEMVKKTWFVKEVDGTPTIKLVK